MRKVTHFSPYIFANKRMGEPIAHAQVGGA